MKYICKQNVYCGGKQYKEGEEYDLSKDELANVKDEMIPVKSKSESRRVSTSVKKTPVKKAVKKTATKKVTKKRGGRKTR